MKLLSIRKLQALMSTPKKNGQCSTGLFHLKSVLSAVLLVSISFSQAAFSAVAVQPTDDDTDDTSSTAQPVQGKSKNPNFNIWEYQVHGVTVFSKETIENSLDGFLGPNKSFATIEAATKALESLYRDSGFPVVSVDIPEQDVVGGAVKINVIEGVVGTVKVVDADYFLLSDIKARLPSIKKGEPLHVSELQQELNKVNSLSSDLRVVPVLKEGDSQGTVDVELKVKDSLPLHGEVEFNNYASANTSDTRLSASIGYDNLWQKYHAFTLQMQITPEAPDEIRVLSGTYLLPIGESISRLAVYGVTSQSSINTFTSTSDGLLIRGNSKIGGLRYVVPIPVNSGFQHVVTTGVEYKDVLEEIIFTTKEKDKGLLTPVTFAVWSGEYKATWRRQESATQLGAGVYIGLRDVFNDSNEFADKRFHGEPNFIYWKASLQESTNLPADFSLVNKLKLQFTDSPLISNEQMSIGGSSTVRGYFESQRLGDRGAMTSIELLSPKWWKKNKYLSDLQLISFLEGGAVEVINPLADQENNFVLASAGLGLQFTSFKDLSVELNWAYPLRSACGDVCGKTVGDVERGASRATFKLSYQY